MKILQLILPSVLALGWVGVHAQQAPDFTEVDADGNGILSIEEAEQAWDELEIMDSNNDGVLNRAEAQRAIPGVTFTTDAAKADDTEPVGVNDYQDIVVALGQQPEQEPQTQVDPERESQVDPES